MSSSDTKITDLKKENIDFFPLLVDSQSLMRNCAPENENCKNNYIPNEEEKTKKKKGFLKNVLLWNT